MKFSLLLSVALLCVGASFAALPTGEQLEGLISFPSPASIPTAANLTPCQACVKFVSHKLVNHSLETVKAGCHNPSSPIYPHCPFIRSHPQFFLGYLVAKTHPVQKALMFCLGAGKCGSDEQPQLQVPELVVDVRDLAQQAREAFPVQAEVPAAPLWHGFDEATPVVASPSPFSSLLQLLTGRADDPTCDACVETFIGVQLQNAFDTIAAYCKAHPTDPPVVRRCLAIQANIPYAAGVVYADTEPMKFAAGLCIGAGQCSTQQATTAQEKVVM
jgi:hypothetical protein